MARDRFATAFTERIVIGWQQTYAETLTNTHVPGMPRCSGRGGRRFKSCHSDQHHTKGADKSHLPANIDHLEPRRRTQACAADGHDTSRRKGKLHRSQAADVREEYARRHGQRFEAKFFAAASTGAPEAKRLFREWETEVTARIDAIRAEHTGEGMALTLRQARALAGEWYVWFIARHPESDHRTWEALRDTVQDALKYAVGEVRWEESNPDDLWWNEAELRETVRPVLADVGETAQFLASKRLVLNNEARGCFLDWLYDDLAAALRRLTRLAKGDYSTDKYPERFPKFSGVDRGETPQQLFKFGRLNASQRGALLKVGNTSSLNLQSTSRTAAPLRSAKMKRRTG